ncbi:hypothetical protein TBR22_A47540 [Luteitalea sp. TBR-22]|nr:hypothetical protein TBR22_A47540 [Luteitalea sp. TBR-22]
MLCTSIVIGAAGARPTAQTATPAPVTPAPAPATFVVEQRGYGLRPEPEPPRYVRPADKTGVPGFEGLDWLDIGLELRSRYEHRVDDYRRPVSSVDDVVLWRTRLYLGVKKGLGPLRFAMELVDSRRSGGQFAPDEREVNLVEPIQAYAELYFASGAGKGRPVSIKAGRQAFEYLDRRLLARNEWRNTSNTFDGLRATVGKSSAAWQLDLLAVRPVRRLMSGLDDPDETQWLAGALLELRRWSRVAILQPYYLHLSQDVTRPGSRIDRDVPTIGLRSYGLIGRSGLDWDVDVAGQFGDDRPRRNRASAFVVEGGYSPRHAWKPRFSANYTYASGDRSPGDLSSNRFERLFGFARPFSASDYIQWENIQAQKARLEITPTPSLRIDTGLSAYWLASATDRWNVAGLRDPTGRSGTHMGNEFDVRVRFPVTARVGLNLGYAVFRPGGFTRSVSGRADTSHMPYAEVTLNAFR